MVGSRWKVCDLGRTHTMVAKGHQSSRYHYGYEIIIYSYDHFSLFSAFYRLFSECFTLAGAVTGSEYYHLAAFLI
jgi:hypothetical protein